MMLSWSQIIHALALQSVGERYLRPLENTSDWAADQQAELLWEEHPGDLTQCWVRLTLQVQNCRSEESDAESEAEENTPVGQRVMGIPFEKSQDPLIHKHLDHRKDRRTSVKQTAKDFFTIMLMQLWSFADAFRCIMSF